MAGEMTTTVAFNAVPGRTKASVVQEALPGGVAVAEAGRTDSPGMLASLIEDG